MANQVAAPAEGAGWGKVEVGARSRSAFSCAPRRVSRAHLQSPAVRHHRTTGIQPATRCSWRKEQRAAQVSTLRFSEPAPTVRVGAGVSATAPAAPARRFGGGRAVPSIAGGSRGVRGASFSVWLGCYTCGAGGRGPRALGARSWAGFAGCRSWVVGLQFCALPAGKIRQFEAA